MMQTGVDTEYLLPSAREKGTNRPRISIAYIYKCTIYDNLLASFDKPLYVALDTRLKRLSLGQKFPFDVLA